MTARQDALSVLAVNGGPKVRLRSWPERGHFGVEEKEAVDGLFDDAIASGRPFGYNGVVEEAFCREFAEFMGGGFVDGVNSGTSAIYVALKALGIEPFTEVIVSAMTDPGGMMPVVLLNCIPMVADTAPDRFAPGPDEIEELISPLTSAIVVPHIAGDPADMVGIMEVALRHGIPVVEDCAQSHAATLNGRMAGTFGDAAAFSTMFIKHMNTGGQGGLVFTRNEGLYQATRRASDRGKPFFMPEGSTNQVASHNLNLNDLAAAIGRVQLRKLPGIIAARRAFVRKITEGVHERELQAVSVTPSLPGAESSYWWLPLKIDAERLVCDAGTFREALAVEGIPVSPISWVLMPHRMEWFRKRMVFGTSGYPWASPLYKGDAGREFPCPNAEATFETHASLAIHESWGDEEAADILTAFAKAERAFLREG